MNWMSILGDIIVALCPIIFTAIIGWVGNYIVKHVKTTNQLNILETVLNIAKQAVITAQKQGLLDNLTGSQQFQSAVDMVKSQLDKLGITDVDIDTIKQKVEEAYASEKDLLETVYAKQNVSDESSTPASTSDGSTK